MDKPIAFFDSGVGGLEYLEAARRILPMERFVYIADRAGFPYGNKNRSSVVDHSVHAIQAMVVTTDPKAVVVACNTATELAIDEIRAAIPGIPVIGTVPAIKAAAGILGVKRIGVIATPGAVAAEYLWRLAREHASHCTVVAEGDGPLVDFVEHRYIRAGRMERLEAVRPGLEKLLGAGVDAIVLGCTHFLHLASEFEELAGPAIPVLDSRGGVASRLKHVLGEDLTSGNPEWQWPDDRMYVTGDGEPGDVLTEFARLFKLVPMGSLP
jgi:glutamate racemase